MGGRKGKGEEEGRDRVNGRKRQENGDYPQTSFSFKVALLHTL